MTWFIDGKELLEFLNSPAFEKHNEMIAVLGRLFESLEEPVRAECRECLATQMERNDRRSLLVEQGRLEYEDFENEEVSEYEHIANCLLPIWFPSLAVKSEGERLDYAYALVDYHMREREIN